MGRRIFLGSRPATTLLELEVTERVFSRTSRFVPHIVPRDGFYCEESWSEWPRLIGVVPELNRERAAGPAERVTARSERLYEIHVDL